MKKPNSVKIISLIVCCSTIMYTPAYACYRHIYNDSGAAWTVGGYGGHGNFYFNNINPDQCVGRITKNSSCVIYPYQTVEIQYTSTGGRVDGLIDITDINHERRSFHYQHTIGFDECPDISSAGNGGSVVFNSGGDGDITFTQTQW